eukprot:TRINITY_DN6052_c0_g1_i1.p1 TRINITY_DN6052_c0_g1~~TRINITY_DN6052_c0_g1_i1.p1  ORF type:complete len:379 (+),score=99.12 TRINITY_DN6052_c0_g1_i1:65-1138(+)
MAEPSGDNSANMTDNVTNSDITPPVEHQTESNVADEEIDSESAPKRRKLTNQEKKAIKIEKRKEFWAQQREKDRKKRKERHKKRVQEIKERGGNPSVELGKKRRKLEDIIFSPQHIAIDLAYGDLMTEKEQRKLRNQLLHSYGVNMTREHPVIIDLPSYNGPIAELMKAMAGFEQWKGVVKHEKGFEEVWPKEKIVYLTAESDEVIQTLNPDEVYIIGGLVDHNRIKGHVHEKITKMGFRTARLPIEEYLEMKTRKVLTVNQVAEILIVVSTNGGNWRAAFEELIPKRKGAKVKGESTGASEEAADVDDQEDGNADDDDDELNEGEKGPNQGLVASSTTDSAENQGAAVAPVTDQSS